MYTIAAMTAYIRYTLLVYIAFQRIDEKHDSKLGERRCSFTLKESLLRVRCAGSKAVLSSTLLDCYWWDILHCVVVVPDRKIFHTVVVRKISLCPPHHNVWSRKSSCRGLLPHSAKYPTNSNPIKLSLKLPCSQRTEHAREILSK
jgi:hypothetical protein